MKKKRIPKPVPDVFVDVIIRPEPLGTFVRHELLMEFRRNKQTFTTDARAYEGYANASIRLANAASDAVFTVIDESGHREKNETALAIPVTIVPAGRSCKWTFRSNLVEVTGIIIPSDICDDLLVEQIWIGDRECLLRSIPAAIFSEVSMHRIRRICYELKGEPFSIQIANCSRELATIQGAVYGWWK